MKCKYCDGGGEIQGFSIHWYDDGIMACPCCEGAGVCTKRHYERFIEKERKGEEELAKMEAE